jgi:hypothetical protein
MALDHEPWKEFAIYELINQEEDALPEDEREDKGDDDFLDEELEDVDDGM